MNYLTLACAYLGIAATQVLASAEKETEIVLVVDNGIAGCPKHRISFAVLDATRGVDAEAETEETPLEPGYDSASDPALAEIEIAPDAGPEQEAIAYDATAGAERQARMSGVSLGDVAEWTESLPERRGERITVHTVRDYVRRGAIRLTARRGDK